MVTVYTSSTCCAVGFPLKVLLSVLRVVQLQVGVYAATVNGLNIGAFMEKGLSMAAGQTPVQAYWFKLLDLIREGKLTPEMVITHELPLTQAAHGYKIFNEKTDNCVKVVLKPGLKSAA